MSDATKGARLYSLSIKLTTEGHIALDVDKISETEWLKDEEHENAIVIKNFIEYVNRLMRPVEEDLKNYF